MMYDKCAKLCNYFMKKITAYISKYQNNLRLFILLICIPGTVLASGTSEQYFWIWAVLLSPIWVSFSIWALVVLSKKDDQTDENNHNDDEGN